MIQCIVLGIVITITVYPYKKTINGQLDVAEVLAL